MRNLRLTLAYDGTNYVGWQIQPNGLSVQAAVERAIKKLTGEDVKLIAAGRTDSGVHALGQVANFHTASAIPCANIQSGIQHSLPGDIIVRTVEEVDAEFHATYWAKRKRYRYVILNRRLPDPFVRKYAYHYRGPLDAHAMHEAAQVLLGTHDFRSFESQFPNKATSVRTVMDIAVGRFPGWPVWTPVETLDRAPAEGGDFIWFDIVADGFLYNMVRAIAGTLLKVGRGVWTHQNVRDILESQDRAQAGETAPAHGLYLVSVDYAD